MFDKFLIQLNCDVSDKIEYAKSHGYMFLYSSDDLNINWENSRPHALRIYAANNLLNGSCHMNKLLLQTQLKCFTSVSSNK